MNRKWRALLPALMLIFAAMIVRQAEAAGNAQINVPSQSLNEIQLVITDAQGQTVQPDAQSDDDRRAGIFWLRNRNSGTYTVRTQRRDGTLVGQPQTFQIADGATTRLRLNPTTGMIRDVSRGMGQGMHGFTVGLLGGAKTTPWDGDVSSTANANRGSGDFSQWMGEMGGEVRYYMSPLQGFGLYLLGSYIHYFGSPEEKFLVNQHPTAGLDVGLAVEENWSMLFGVGTNLNILQRVGLGIMGGFHVTKMEFSILANESGGGGANNRLTDSKTVIGPWLGAELYYTLYCLGVPVDLFMRSTARFMPDMGIDRMTSPFNFNYHGHFDGGANIDVMTGFRIPLHKIPRLFAAERY
jgi:hypothetical protein